MKHFIIFLFFLSFISYRQNTNIIAKTTAHINSLTACSGEITAILFIGHPNVNKWLP